MIWRENELNPPDAPILSQGTNQARRGSGSYPHREQKKAPGGPRAQDMRVLENCLSRHTHTISIRRGAELLSRYGSDAPRPAAGKQRAGTCHNADSPRTVAMTILPTQGLAAGSVPAESQRIKKAPGTGPGL